MRTTILIILAVVTSIHSHLAAQEPDYLAIMDKALYIEYAEARMEVYKNDKLEKYYTMEFYRKDMKMRMEFLEPAVEKGRRMLNDENNMWMYLPRTSKVMKLPLKQAFMGSDASNRDLMRIAFSQDYDLAGIRPVDGNTLELELKAKDLSVSYNRVLILYDKGRNVPVRQEMYSLSGKLIKTLEYGYAQAADGTSYAAELIIRDELLKNTLTKMYYTKVKRSNNKPSVYFTLGSLKQ